MTQGQKVKHRDLSPDRGALLQSPVLRLRPQRPPGFPGVLGLPGIVGFEGPWRPSFAELPLSSFFSFLLSSAPFASELFPFELPRLPFDGVAGRPGLELPELAGRTGPKAGLPGVFAL